MPQDDELAEFFRAVLPEQEPPVPLRFVADARLAGKRIKARRRIQIGLAAFAVTAVMAGAGAGAWMRDSAEQATTPTVGRDSAGGSPALDRLALAVQRNLAEHMRELNIDIAVMPATALTEVRPVVWRIDLHTRGARTGWIDIVLHDGGGTAKSRQLLCPVSAFDLREGQNVPCALNPDAGRRVPPGTSAPPDPIETLAVGSPTGLQVVVTAHPQPEPTGVAEVMSTEPHNDGVAPLDALEMRDILRHGDAPAALTALLGIGA